ncbi:TetR/AcrR family transcriptional regulator [Oscillospiraceae bacterium MB08-C2-2]|nr:TetR/AcrR family transcriptional regulator [Oscillospiraceae bacterium MB08-C2-2]
MKSKRQLQKENTRNKIVETAYIVYSEQGFSATTATIAKEAGVSHGTIFVHFPSVDELLCAVIEDFGDSLGLELHTLAEKKCDIREFLRTHLNVLSKHENFYLRLITEKNLLPDETRISLVKLQSITAYHFSKIIEQDYERQGIKDIPIHLLFNTWMGLIHYYLQNKELFSPEDPLIDRYSEELTGMFLKLIGK